MFRPDHYCSACLQSCDKCYHHVYVLCGSSDALLHNIIVVCSDKVSACNELLAQVAKRAERVQLLVIIEWVDCLFGFVQICTLTVTLLCTNLYT